MPRPRPSRRGPHRGIQGLPKRTPASIVPVLAVSLLVLSALALAACRAAPRDASPVAEPVRISAAGVARHADAILEIGRRAVTEVGIHGLAIGIAVGGETVFAEGFGHADLARERRAQRDTVFDVASVGKQFTAAAILRLVETGYLSLDDRVREFVPEAPESFPTATVYELLHHTSGFEAGDYELEELPPDIAEPRRGAEVLDDLELRRGRVRFAPSETWMYCNPGYVLLGLVVERASGRPYAAFVREEILRRAGVDGMTVGERAEPSRMAESLIRESDTEVRPMPRIHMSAYGGQGSICSSVVDLLAWQEALASGRVVSKASRGRMTSPAVVRGRHATAELPYGMGLRLGTFDGHRKEGQTGTFPGGSSVLAHYPDIDLTIAVLSNTYGEVPHARALEGEIAARILDGVDRSEGIRAPDRQLDGRLTVADARRIEGVYMGDEPYEARIEDERLVVTRVRDGKELVRLDHVGGWRFAGRDGSSYREWFLPDGDQAGWWVIEKFGFISSNHVLRRVPAKAPERSAAATRLEAGPYPHRRAPHAPDTASRGHVDADPCSA